MVVSCEYFFKLKIADISRRHPNWLKWQRISADIDGHWLEFQKYFQKCRTFEASAFGQIKTAFASST